MDKDMRGEENSVENPKTIYRARAWLVAMVLVTLSFVAALWLALLWADWRFVLFAVWWLVVILVLASAGYGRKRP